MKRLVLLSGHMRSRSSLALIACLLFALMGAWYVLHSHAETLSISQEAETGTATGGARVVSNASASGGQAVTFEPTQACPSGECMPLGDVTNTNGVWHQIFTDDFTAPVALGGFPGSQYSAKWGAYGPGWPDTSHNGTYDASKVVSVVNGLLDLYLHTEGGVHYVSAPTPTISGYGQTYGRYAVRFRADQVAGYKTAWLLWPDSEDWNEGEIDFPEGDLNGTISAFSHCVKNPSQNCFSADSPASYNSWHTAVTEWSPGKVAFYLDGSLLGTATQGVPTTSMHYVLQTETSLDKVPANSATGHVQIDWVAIWSRQ